MKFVGRTLPEPPNCAFPGCKERGEHRHHITYDPEVTKYLCARHHEEITILNGQQSRKYRRELSNRHRWWVWFQWTQGKMKVRRTKRALEYIEEWQARSLNALPEEVQNHGGPRNADMMKTPTRKKRMTITRRKKAPRTSRGKRKRVLPRKTAGRGRRKKQSASFRPRAR